MNIVHSIILLQPGLYLLRHPGRGLAPLGFSVAPDSQGSLKTLATNDGVLRSGRDCIAAHVVDAPVRLTVLAYLRHAGDEVPQLRLDQVRLDDAGAAQEQAQEQEQAPQQAAVAAPGAPAGGRVFEVPAQGISLVGHVERIGDALALPGDVLGNAGDMLRLEGFQVVWPDCPPGVELVSTVVLEDHGAMPDAGIGRFCGTRNMARRIVEVTLTLGGPGAAGLALDGTAYFSGDYAIPVVSGRALGGPSGLEHLTGLRLQVVRARADQPGAWAPASGAHVFPGAGGRESKQLQAARSRS